MHQEFDVENARGFFPALQSEWALFDNAGGSVAPRPVIDRVADYMSRLHVQHGASYPASVEATEIVAAGRRAAATLVNAEADEIVLGPSTTMNVLVLAQALRPTMREGDAIVVTELDHEANIGAWRRLEATGIEIREWKLDPATAALRIEDLDPLLDERTRLVCFTHCSNVVGTIHDVRAMTAHIHAAGAEVCVDGVAFAPHRRVDVRELGVDYYLVSLYKVYGPHLGLLYARQDRIDRLANVNHFFVGDDARHYKLTPGNVVHELAASVIGIVDYLRELHRQVTNTSSGSGDDRWLKTVFDAIAAHEEAIVTPLLDWLAERPDVRILGERSPNRALRVPTVAFTVPGRHASSIPECVDESKVAIRWGDFYAARAIDALGLRDAGGIVRASLVHYNTRAEVDRLIEALDRTLG